MQYPKFKAFLIPLFLSTPNYAATIDRSKSNVEIAFAEGNKADLEVTTGVSYTSNFLYSDHDEASDSGYFLKADAFLQTHSDTQLLQVYGKAIRNQFDDYSDDSHTTVTALGKYYFKLSSEQRLFASATYDELFEYRGTGLSLGSGDELSEGDERVDMLFNAGYQYGRTDSVSRFNLTAGVFDSEYRTREALTKAFNYERSFVASNLDYLAAGATYITLEVDFSDFTFDNSPDFDRNELLILAGIRNELSEASSVILLLGTQKVSYDLGGADKNEFAWKTSYSWRPTDFLNISFASERKTNETPEVQNDLRVDERFGITARYLFSDSLAFTAKADIIKADIESNGSGREDDLVVYDLSLNYSINDRVGVYAEIVHRDRDSQLDDFSYQRIDSTFGISVKF